jgi:hypothetical protein
MEEIISLISKAWEFMNLAKLIFLESLFFEGARHFYRQKEGCYAIPPFAYLFRLILNFGFTGNTINIVLCTSIH